MPRRKANRAATNRTNGFDEVSPEGDTDVTQVVDMDEQIDDEQLTDEEPDLDKLQTDFAFRGPVSLRLAVEENAKAASLGVSQYLRKVVADHIGYSLQANPGRATLSEEQKKQRAEEAKQKAKAERARIAALLKQQRGEVSTGK